MMLLALPAVASPERIGIIDYDIPGGEWPENTDFGLPYDHERTAWDDLVWCDSLGPYVKAYWLGNAPGATLPWVRGMMWCDERSYWGDHPRIRVDVITYDGRFSYLVERLPEYSPYFGPAKEAMRRVLRVLVRREHGFHTAYTA